MSNLSRAVLEDLPAPGQVHLWLSRPHNAPEEWLHTLARDILADEEISKSRRFHFACDRRRFLLTRILQRTLLSRYYSIAPKDWVFSQNSFGRPCIAPGQQEQAIEFNISHTERLVALALGRHVELGIDIEWLGRTTSRAGIADRFFAPAEAAELGGVPPHLRDRRFLEFWTLKEAYIKARGRGLSIPLDSFAFSVTPDVIRFAADTGEGRCANSWQFLQFEACGDHVGALCIGGSNSAPTRFTAREIVPFRWERDVDLKIIRRSG